MLPEGFLFHQFNFIKFELLPNLPYLKIAIWINVWIGLYNMCIDVHLDIFETQIESRNEEKATPDPEFWGTWQTRSVIFINFAKNILLTAVLFQTKVNMSIR